MLLPVLLLRRTWAERPASYMNALYAAVGICALL